MRLADRSTIFAGCPMAPDVFRFRTFLARHGSLAAWLVVLSLLMKMLVPAGYMVGSHDGVMTIQVCTSMGIQTVQIDMDDADGHHGDQSEQMAMDQPCAFSGLFAPALGGADSILLALAIAFILATTFRLPQTPSRRGRAYLYPPAQGPPATA